MANSNLLYMQIRNYLLDIIEKNKDIPNFKLPSENQLCIKFNSSRISAKKAISTLEADGFIYRQQGKGTFISDNAIDIISPKSDKPKDTICLVIPNVGCNYVNKIIEGIQSYLHEKNMILNIMITHSDQDIEKISINSAIQMNCKGLLIFPSDNEIYSNEIVKLSLNRFPTVLIDRNLNNLNISYVSCDHYNASFNGTKYLIKKGHTNIGFISQQPDAASSVQERIRGYENAMKCIFQDSYDRYRLCIDDPDADLIKVIKDYIQINKELSAIITTSGYFGLRLLHAINQLNLKIPNDLELMFFDNEFGDYSQLLSFKSIIIDQNPFHIGYTASEILYGLIYKNPKPRKKMIQETIIDN